MRGFDVELDALLGAAFPLTVYHSFGSREAFECGRWRW